MKTVEFDQGLVRDEVKELVVTGSSELAQELGLVASFEARQQIAFANTSVGRRRVGLGTHEDWYMKFKSPETRLFVAQFVVRSLVDADQNLYGGFEKHIAQNPEEQRRYDFITLVPSEERHPGIDTDLNSFYTHQAAAAIEAVLTTRQRPEQKSTV